MRGAAGELEWRLVGLIWGEEEEEQVKKKPESNFFYSLWNEFMDDGALSISIESFRLSGKSFQLPVEQNGSSSFILKKEEAKHHVEKFYYLLFNRLERRPLEKKYGTKITNATRQINGTIFASQIRGIWRKSLQMPSQWRGWGNSLWPSALR